MYEVPKPKFERQVLLENVTRIKQFIPKGSTIVRLKKSYSDIIAWREPARTVKYFVFYMFFVYYFRSARTLLANTLLTLHCVQRIRIID